MSPTGQETLTRAQASSDDRRASGRVVFIGAAGEMCRLAVERFAKAPGHWELTLADNRPEPLYQFVKELPRDRATAQMLDLYDAADLAELIAGASLVVLGAGPYLRTAAPVIEACLRAGVPYLDFDDDVESTEHALSLHERAEAAGIPIYVGCGASPGMSNVLAVDAASDLDTVERIDMCWLIGEERPHIGRAVVEHMLHISAGDCVTWEHGRRVVHESFVETGTAPMGGGLGEQLLYETAHPEAVTMPRRYPQADRIRVIGGLEPFFLNGMARGVGLAVHNGDMTIDEALDFTMAVINYRVGSRSGYKHSLKGILSQIKRKEATRSELVPFLRKEALREREPWRGGLLARVYGTKDGMPGTAIRRTPTYGPQTYLTRNMATLTGTPCAAFMVLALRQGEGRAGVFAPEDWVDPKDFYEALVQVGTPRHEIVERG